MLGGGWDISTLNVIMAQTNGGKCFFGDGEITIRKSGSSNIENIKIGKMFSDIRKGHKDI
jgi:hypothetical protein